MNIEEFNNIVIEFEDILESEFSDQRGALAKAKFMRSTYTVRFTLFQNKGLQLACGNIQGDVNTVAKAIHDAFHIGDLEELKNQINRGEEQILCKVNTSKGKEPRTLVSVEKDAQAQFMRKTIALYQEAN